MAGLIAALMVPVNLMPDSVSEAFQYAFMQRALLTSMMVSHRSMLCYVAQALVVAGDAISHAVLPGSAATCWALFYRCLRHRSADVARHWAIERHTESTDADHVYQGICAGVLISKIASSTHLMHILFGNVLGVQQSALLLTLAASLVALLVVWLAYRRSCFTPRSHAGPRLANTSDSLRFDPTAHAHHRSQFETSVSSSVAC